MERLDALGDPGLRTTLLFARAQERPVTADDVADGLDVPRTVARWRLERLAEAALLVPAFERRSGRTGPGAGRPAKTYAVAAETTPIEFPVRHYDELLRLLIEALPRRGRTDRLAEVGVAFGHQLAQAGNLRPAKRTRTAFDHICRALGNLGFHASIESASDKQAVIVTATCPLRPLVVEEHEARQIDQGMWRGLVEQALAEVAVSDVVCRTHNCLEEDSACRVVIDLSPARHPPPKLPRAS